MWLFGGHLNRLLKQIKTQPSPYRLFGVSASETYVATSAKTEFPSLNLFSLLYPQTQKNEIEVSLKCGIALLFQSVL